MTTFCSVKHKCGLCGHKFKSQAIMSTNSFGSPDLDLRPPEMQRSTMRMWLDKCPKCGYVHSEIEKSGKKHKSFIKTDDYKTCEGTNLLSSLACDFYKYALILLRDDNKMAAYDAFLHAAWACDDNGDENGAIFCRNKAITLYEDELFKENSNLVLRHIDLLRRVGRFEEAIKFCESVQFKDELMQKVTKFQKELSKGEDTACYRVIDSESILMKLYDEPFELVKNGKKRIEVRCNDEKRRKLKVGDKIIFSRYSNPKEKLFAEITDLKSFKNFKELYMTYPLESFGYLDKTVDDMVAAVNEIYSETEQAKYGAIAISISVWPYILF